MVVHNGTFGYSRSEIRSDQICDIQANIVYCRRLASVITPRFYREDNFPTRRSRNSKLNGSHIVNCILVSLHLVQIIFVSNHTGGRSCLRVLQISWSDLVLNSDKVFFLHVGKWNQLLVFIRTLESADKECLPNEWPIGRRRQVANLDSTDV